MLKVGEIDPTIIDHAIPDKVDGQHEDGVSRVEDEVEEEVREPESSGRNAGHKLQVFTLRQ